MGRYHDEKNPVLLVAQRRDRMDLFPVKLTRDIDAGKLCEIDRQMEESMNFLQKKWKGCCSLSRKNLIRQPLLRQMTQRRREPINCALHRLLFT